MVVFEGIEAEEPGLRPPVVLGIMLALSAVATLMLAFAVLARNAAERRERLLADILSTTTDAIVSIDVDSRILMFNPAAEGMFGRSVDDVLGRSLDILMPATALATHHDHVVDIVGAAEPTRRMGDWRSVRGLRADGTEFPVMASLGRSRTGGATLLTAILRDMTDVQRLNDDTALEAREMATKRGLLA